MEEMVMLIGAFDDKLSPLYESATVSPIGDD